ncbi:hypothetical protein EDF56_101646 [Novosphingobium sp. PhB165]|uniref:hypothetical protein n=1 Tax=Novosphingobium sp. PhB165 TaxID=2485105 RepID=UPI001051D237|nr:hypothetical protein [Novosphingobium sp. PhB165]TCM21969.1 hypothetical protein EDF56_101646 [Novosphingobium sp. PhB165]
MALALATMLPGVAVAAAPPAASAPPTPTPLSPEVEHTLAAKLGECFVMKSTGEDRVAFARWFVAALGSAPQVADIAKIDPAQKDGLDRQVATIFTRLIAVDCAEQARPLYQVHSSAGFSTAGEALGRIAMQELMSNPDASAKMFGGYTAYIRDDDFKNLEK